jgi:TolB-like protein
MKGFPVRLPGSGLALLLALLLAVLPPAVSAAEKKAAARKTGAMVFLPFTVKTQPPQEHLRAGLTSVLATRMADRTGLAAVHGADKTGGLEAQLQQGRQQEARKILSQLGGDWLLLGSLEQRGQGYEVKIHVFSGGKAAPASFSHPIDTLDKTIPAIDALSEEIAAKVFHQNTEGEQTAAAVLSKDGAGGFQTAHPDKAWRDGMYAAAGPAAPLSPAAGDSAFRRLNSLSSGELRLSLKAMDAGDLDGDGREELVLLEQGRLLLARFSADRFQQVAELPLPSHLGLHAVHLADINGDGRPEICISASSGSIPSSQALSWDGKKFHRLHEQVPFYLRPDLDAAGQPALLGQAGGSIFRLAVSQAGELVRAEEMTVPQGFSLHDFIRADLNQDGRPEFIGLTEENSLLVQDQDGKPLWKSAESYGASREALGTLASRRKAELDQPYDRERVYIHTRIAAQDLTGDGRPEIIVSRNRVTNVDYFKNLRWFEGSSVAVLSWDGSRMNTLWESGHSSGYTVDYQALRDAAQPGRFRLFIAESSDSGNPLYFWSKEKTVIKMEEMTAAAKQ